MILTTQLQIVKIREKKKMRKRAYIKEIAVKLLDKQIELLSGGKYERVTLELEISKFIKDCLIMNLETGKCDAKDIRKAHARLKKEFKEDFEIWSNADVQ